MATGDTDSSFLPAVSRFLGDETPTMVDGDGAVLVDAAGNEYVDFFAMHAAMSHGYCHPDVVEAVREQVGRLNFSAYDFPTEPSRDLASRLAAVAPGDLSRTYFVNSGSEAVEVALTLARRATGNHEFLCLTEGFHGRTYGARSLVGYKGYREGFGPFLSGVTHVPSYNCEFLDGDGPERAEIVEHMIQYASGDVAAFVAEPMFGTAGNIPAPEGYFERVKEICDDHGVLFVADEVITGFGRTGERFGIEHYDVEPDIVTTAKALGGGMAIGATLATEEVAASFESMDYFSTFGGNPVACAAGLASLEVMEREDLPGRARELGSHALERLHAMQSDHDVVGEVRGRGLMIGVDLVDADGDPLPAEHSVALREMALDRGLVLPAGQGWRGNTIRISPPLVITREQLDRGLDVLAECLAEMD
jgi:4-aminobutyrate aminotransferase/(S)-3-amino-2-methylpropionate transaminase